MNEKKTHEKISHLRKVLGDSIYTVALYGFDIMEESGFIGTKKQDKAYDIEDRHNYGMEGMYSSAFYNTHPERFLEFYKNEILHSIPRDTPIGPVLTAMERNEEFQCVIDNNVYDSPRRGGCRQVVNLRGSTYQDRCPRCKKGYPLPYIVNARCIPIYETCNIPVKSMISLVGEVVGSQNMTRTTEEVTKADVLLLLGTTMASGVLRQYIKYFIGNHITVIHKQEHYLDKGTSLVILDYLMSVFPELGYGEEAQDFLLILLRQLYFLVHVV